MYAPPRYENNNPTPKFRANKREQSFDAAKTKKVWIFSSILPEHCCDYVDR